MLAVSGQQSADIGVRQCGISVKFTVVFGPARGLPLEARLGAFPLPPPKEV